MTIDTFSGAILSLVFASFVVERGLSLILESGLPPWLRELFDSKSSIAFFTALVFVVISDLNVVEMMIPPSLDTVKPSENPLYRFGTKSSYFLLSLSYILTALVVASGSKASLKLFRDVLNIQSTVARDLRQEREIEKTMTTVQAAAAGDQSSKSKVFAELEKGKDVLKKNN